MLLIEEAKMNNENTSVWYTTLPSSKTTLTYFNDTIKYIREINSKSQVLKMTKRYDKSQTCVSSFGCHKLENNDQKIGINWHFIKYKDKSNLKTKPQQQLCFNAKYQLYYLRGNMNVLYQIIDLFRIHWN